MTSNNKSTNQVGNRTRDPIFTTMIIACIIITIITVIITIKTTTIIMMMITKQDFGKKVVPRSIWSPNK